MRIWIMIPIEIYKLGQSLGLDKKDIDRIKKSSIKMENNTVTYFPINVYKGSSHYGTISIKDL